MAEQARPTKTDKLAFEIEGCAHYDRCDGEAQGHKAPKCRPFCYRYQRTRKILQRWFKKFGVKP